MSAVLRPRAAFSASLLPLSTSRKRPPALRSQQREKSTETIRRRTQRILDASRSPARLSFSSRVSSMSGREPVDLEAEPAEPGAGFASAASASAPNSGESWSKVHTSALCIIPPEELWEPIQSIRRTHDKQINRWMPHINVAYPFCGARSFPRAAEALATELASVPPFRVRLEAFGYFEHGARSSTVWLRPDADPPGSLQALQAAVVRAIPPMDDLSARFGEFRPHLSVGQFRGRRDAEQAAEGFAQGWGALEWEVR
eukprot:tig00000227_g19795.t1